MNDILRAGFIGSGVQAGYLMRHAWLRARGVKVVTCFDVNPENARRFAATYDVRPTGSIKEMAALGLDLVAICTPPAAHTENVLELLSAKPDRQIIGIHCEKPSALDLTAHDAMTRGATSHGAVLTFGYDRLFSAARWIAEMLRLGILGDLDHIRLLWYRFDGIPKRGVFLNRRLSGGGPGFDLLPHLVAISFFIAGTGDARRVQAVTHQGILRSGGSLGAIDASEADVEDSIHGLATLLHGGKPATLTFSTAWDLPIPGDRFSVEVVGTRGSAMLGREPLPPEDERYVARIHAVPTRQLNALLPSLSAGWSHGHAFQARRQGPLIELRPPQQEPSLSECRSAQLADLAATVLARRSRQRRDPVVTPEFARGVLEFVLAAYTSAGNPRS
jgi:predicted dehydrogenase